MFAGGCIGLCLGLRSLSKTSWIGGIVRRLGSALYRILGWLVGGARRDLDLDFEMGKPFLLVGGCCEAVKIEVLLGILLCLRVAKERSFEAEVEEKEKYRRAAGRRLWGVKHSVHCVAPIEPFTTRSSN